VSRVDLPGCATSQKRQQRPQTFTSAAECTNVAFDCRIERRRCCAMRLDFSRCG
jgi:hypothetical protein